MASLAPRPIPISLIGHPFAPIGRGEDLRTMYRGLRAVGLTPQIVDVYEPTGGDPGLASELAAHVRESTGGGVDIFCINGDEVEPVLAHLGSRRRSARYSIIFPTWELPAYPRPWATALERFDEIWAPSAFVRDALSGAVSRPVTLIPEPTGVRLSRFIGRRDFGIPESAYAFLFAFDLRSYQQRKNPLAVLDAYAAVVRARPSADMALVVKMAGADVHSQAADLMRQAFRARTERLGLGRVLIIERDLTDSETKNLVRNCDAFVSLHRSEGFGRFLAEAMLLGKPVVATNYSGNLEFMNPDVACLVSHRLIPVNEGEYPFWQDQVWADPDVDEAAACMTRLVDDPAAGRRLGERASRHIRSHFSYRAIGLQYLERLRAAAAG
jgi:glycosyltransferase involved in cell wall biosynthesis